MINDLAVDSVGYLWIATKDGLNRYDGNEIKVFRHDPNDSLSISDNFVSKLHVDHRGKLWVATQSEGLNLFNPNTNGFLRLNSKNSNLSSDFLGAMVESTDGKLLVQTLDRAGYNAISLSETSDDHTGSNYRISRLEEEFPALWEIDKGKDWTKELMFDSYGTIWYCTRDSVYMVSNNGAKGADVKQYHHSLSRDHFTEDGPVVFLGHNKQEVYQLDHNGQLKKFNRSSLSFELVHQTDYLNNTKGRFFVDSKNQMWAFNTHDQLIRLGLADDSFTLFEPMWRLYDDGVRNHRSITAEDQNGNLWIGTGGSGVLQINPESLRFKLFDGGPSGLHPAKDGHICLFRAATTTNKGLYDSDLAVRWLNMIGLIRARNPNIRLFQNYTQLAVDNDGSYWMSANIRDVEKDCVTKFNPKDGSIDTVICKDASPNQDRWFGHPIFLTKDGNIWFSEKGADGVTGLYKLDPKTRQMKEYLFPVSTNKFQYRMVSDWYEDPQGKLWLATTHGLFGFDPKTETWKTKQRGKENGDLSSNMLLSVLPDPSNEKILWVGTEGAGLDRVHLDSNKVTNFSTLQGLPNNVVYGIQADFKSNLWLSTNNGLSQFDPSSQTFFNYGKSDGLPGNEFNRYEYSHTATGEFYFGGTSGLVSFNPVDFYVSRPASELVINRLKILNQEIEYNSKDSRIPAPIEQLEHLTLTPDEDIFTFGFTMLDLTNPGKQKFKYRMLGYNEEWIEVGNARSATYTNLEPGDHVFQVIGMNSSGTWTEKPTSLHITILAPWYATWWFRTAVFFLLVGLVYSFYRYRLNQLLNMERMRNRIAQDLHDEIGSTLSSISLFGSVLKSNLNGIDEKSAGILDKITSSTSEMMESMNDMVWTIKSDNDRFEHVINRMRSFAVNVCEAKGIELRFSADNNADKLNLDMELRKNIYLIYKESINNAIKYSKATDLVVDIQVSGSLLHLRVADNGIGFDQQVETQNELNLGRNGLKGMRKRAQEINAEISIKSDEGTTIDVQVPLQSLKSMI